MKVYLNGYPISAPFGSIDPSHLVPHKGVDFGVPIGTPIPSVGDGVVTAITDEGNKSFGLAVHMRMKDGADVVYGHLSSTQLHSGQVLHAGDIIGLSGSTGDSTGPHLHLQMMKSGIPIDPLLQIQSPQHNFLENFKQIWGFSQDLHQNGWFHAITGETTGQFAGEFIQAVGTISLGGVLVALPLACFGLKIGRKWTVRFLAGYLLLTIVGASIKGM